MKLYTWVESLATFTINICFATALVLGMTVIVGTAFFGINAIFKKAEKKQHD
jgi:hypothetical protein